MKKRILNVLLSGIVLIAGAILISSCLFGGRENLETICQNKLDEASDAYGDFAQELTSSSCEDFKDAWNDYFETCYNYQYYSASLETAFDDLHCSDFAK